MLIASASFVLKCHDLQTGEIVHNYTPNLAKNAYIKHFTWNKDGTWLAITPTEGSTFILSIRSANVRQLHTVTNIQAPTCSVFKYDTKKYLSLGTASGSVLTYDFKTEAIIKKYPKVDSGIFSLYYCASDSHLIAGCTNGEVIVFNANTKIKSSKFRVPNSKTLSCLKPHQKKRQLLAGGSENGLVAIWDLNDSKLKYCQKFHNAPVKEVSFLPNRDDILFSMGMDKKMRFQDIKTNTTISEINFDQVMTCMDVSYDATNLIIGTRNGNIFVYDVRNFKLPKLSIKKAHDSWIEKIAVQTSNVPNIDSESSLEEQVSNSKSAVETTVVPSTTIALSIIAEETSQENKKAKLSAADSFLDELGINASLNSPINTAPNKRRSSQNFKQQSTSECSEADSFLDALGLNSPIYQQQQNKMSRKSVGPIISEVKHLLEENPSILEQNKTASPSLISKARHSLLLERVQVLEESPDKKLEDNFAAKFDFFINTNIDAQKTSTPKITVTPESADDKLINVELIRKIVKEEIAEYSNLLRKEFNDIITDFKGAIKEQTDLLMQEQKVHMWRLYRFHKELEADKHLFRVKESVKIEEAFTDLAMLITGDIVREDANFRPLEK